MTRLFALAVLAAAGCTVSFLDEAPAPRPDATLDAPTVSALCGDAIVDVGEQCDDGNHLDGDGCNRDCRIGLCGDAVVDPGEQCDAGGLDTATCDVDCTFAVCGDGHRNVAAGEVCDEGSNPTTDSCAPDCRSNGSDGVCGNGLVEAGAGEQCDDGNVVSGDGCSTSCQLE